MSDSGSATPSGMASSSTLPPARKDRHEPRGRKPNDKLPPSRAREVQRAFRLRRAEHLASLEERINALEAENSQLRRLLNIPDADRPKIGTGPTGRGKSLREGGVPMSERVRARREAARAREKQNKELGLPSDPNDKADMELDSDHDLGEDEEGDGEGELDMAEGMSGRGTPGGGGGGTRSPKGSMPPPQSRLSQNNSNSVIPLPLFQPPPEGSAFNYELPLPFNTSLSPDNPFNDFESAIFKPSSAGTPFSNIFSIYDEPATPHTQHQPPPLNRQYSQPDHHLLQQHQNQNQNQNSSHNRHTNGHHSHSHSSDQSRASPISPPAPGSGSTPAQPELLTRLKQCCHLSDSHVVNDPGLLIFATRLCQSFPCSYGGGHPESLTAISDSDYLLLDDSWRALRNQLDPNGENDGEHRINTGRMAAEMVIRAASCRGPGPWITCRFREGMSIKRSLVGGLVNGLGGNFE